jgi:hypothetical protein
VQYFGAALLMTDVVTITGCFFILSEYYYIDESSTENRALIKLLRRASIDNSDIIFGITPGS